MKSFSIKQINDCVNGEVIGDLTQIISGPEQLERANPIHITFIGSSKYARLWERSGAGAAVINETLEIEPGEGRSFIKVKNADLAMAKILELFAPEHPEFEHNIHPTAVLHSTVKLGDNCKIGAGCYLGKNVVLGDGVILYPNVTIFEETTIGDQSVIWSGTVVRERSEIGKYCIIHINVSIGADGFGYRPGEDGKGRVKIPQIGNVIIGNGVEIGANSSIDRGKLVLQ